MKNADKILILGSHGMLGSALAHEFAEFHPTELNQPELDVTNEKELPWQIDQLKPAWIINATGYTAVDNAETQESAARAVNQTGVANIALAARKVGATVVHFSTDYVFDGQDPHGYAEDALVNPQSAYGRSKAGGEQALVQSGATYYLIRTAWLYGPHGKNFVETMLSLIKTGRPITVVTDQKGSPTYTVDLAQATRALMEDWPDFGIYHLVNSGVTSWYDFAKEIFSLSGHKVDLRSGITTDVPRPARRPACSWLLNTKRPGMRPWQSALKDYLSSRL